MFVGIDQSYTGFAATLLLDDRTHRTVLRKFGGNKVGSGINRLMVIDDWLQTLLYTWEKDFERSIQHVCIEGYANGVKFGREQSGELGATVKRALFEFGDGRLDKAFPTIVPPTSLKKYVTGKGTAKKNEILLGVYRKWGAEFDDDNKADSYGLAHMAWDIYHSASDLAYEWEAICSLTPHTERL